MIMFVKTYIRDNLAVIIMSDNVNWVQFNRGTEICSVRLRPDKAGAILVYDFLLKYDFTTFTNLYLSPRAVCCRYSANFSKISYYYYLMLNNVYISNHQCYLSKDPDFSNLV